MGASDCWPGFVQTRYLIQLQHASLTDHIFFYF
jgi:hypothetical protein